jgi:lipopolysaccharide/colanic/teichoic acid biosynthesis glycosyltransferase
MLEPNTEVPCGTRSLDDRLLRVGDFLIATLLIAFTLPLMMFVYTAIKLDSVGPAIYHPLRNGRSGRFQLQRFRTTVHDPERGPRAKGAGWAAF